MPNYKLKELCEKYKNNDGYVEFDNIVYIAEYFGVSFESCIYKIAYVFNMIEGDTDSKTLKNRIKKYHPDIKRKKLISKTNDFLLYGRYK